MGQYAKVGIEEGGSKVKRRGFSNEVHFRSPSRRVRLYKISLGLWVLFPVFICCLCRISYAASTLVEGDVELLGPLTYTKCLNGHPAIFFSQQQGQDGISLLDKVDNILLTTGPEKLILELLESRFVVAVDKSGNGDFCAPFGGLCELWFRLKKAGATQRAGSLPERLEIDGQVIEEMNSSVREGSRWIRLAEVYLSGGKHRLFCRGQSVGRGELVVIPKIELQKYIARLTYLCKRSKVKTGYMFSQVHKDLDLRLKRHFREPTYRFRVMSDGYFDIKGVFNNNYFTSTKQYPRGVLFNLIDHGGTDGLIPTKIKAEGVNCDYRKQVDTKGVTITAAFDGHEDEPEFVRVEYRPEGGNSQGLKVGKNSSVILTYQIEDSAAQEVKLVFWMADRDDKTLPRPLLVTVNNMRLAAFGEPVSFCVNLVDRLKESGYGAKDFENIYLERMDLLLGKKKGLDCSGRNSIKRSFLIKGMRFMPENLLDIRARDFPERQLFNNKQRYYFTVSEDSSLKNAGSLSEIPWEVKTVYEPQIIDYVDLKESPVVDMSVSSTSKQAIQKYHVTYYLDFRGDEKPDGTISMEEFGVREGSRQGKDRGRIRIVSRDLFREARKAYPGRNKYHLVYLDLSIGNGEVWRYRTYSGIFQELQRKAITDVRIHPELMLDGRVLVGKPELSNAEPKSRDHGDVQLDFGTVRLQQGEHTLKVKRRESWNERLIELEPVNNGSTPKVQGSPEIDFEKVNPTRYVVSVKRAERPFWLVFSESFHKGWKAYARMPEIRSQKSEVSREQRNKNEQWSALISAWRDRGKRIELTEHHLVNGYANAWWVDVGRLKAQGVGPKADSSDEFEIVLEFKPQRLFEIGIMISALTFLGCIVFLLATFLRRRKAGKR